MKSRVIRFVKDWTLPISIGLGSAIYLVFSHIHSLDGLTSGLEPFWEMCLPFCTFWVLYVTFCKVDFHKMRPARWHFLVLLAQFLIVAIIVSLAYFLELSGNTRLMMESLLACAISPVATAAPVVTQKLGGNLEEMTACAFLSNILSAVLIPVSFTLISDNQEITFLQGVGKISADVALVLLLPLACAYVTKHYLHGLHRRVVGVRDLAYYLWCVNLVLVSGITVRNIANAPTSGPFLLLIAAAVMMACALLFWLGRTLGKPFNASVNGGQALMQKNTAFAIWVANTYLNPLSAVGPGCYILWQNIVNSVEIWAHGRQANRS
ncbi:MAG TPA: transporter [Candidatus Prevotella avicola]|uniref:Transporter n=1 Tax=Candidatus Prevotella avicola TaxID=2838738 RepID=A0A9D2FYT3_9BACT|nr:transporter [Candidatus Prevotella avicola]